MSYDPAKYLFLKIVQKANERKYCNLTEFVRLHANRIQQVGSVLKVLGLAERRGDDWAATGRLMSMIAEQLARGSRQKSKVVVTDHDVALLDSLFYRATGIYDLWSLACDDDPDVGDEELYELYWCCNVLVALGLLKEGKGKDSEFKPTRRLERLFDRVVKDELAAMGLLRTDID